MIEKELLNIFYKELLELIGEEAMLIFYNSYQGLTLTIPMKLYSGEKIAKKLATIQTIDLHTKQKLARKYDYSQRQIERLIRQNR